MFGPLGVASFYVVVFFWKGFLSLVAIYYCFFFLMFFLGIRFLSGFTTCFFVFSGRGFSVFQSLLFFKLLLGFLGFLSGMLEVYEALFDSKTSLGLFDWLISDAFRAVCSACARESA